MKRLLLVLIAFTTFAISGAAANFYNREDDLSLRYILWKQGIHPYPSTIIDHAVIADQNRDYLIKGKTKEQIKNIFRDVHEESVNDYQKMYEKQLEGREYLWLGTGGVIIFLKDGKGETISIMKG